MNRRTDILVGVTMGLVVVGVTLTGLVLRQPWPFSLIAWLMVAIYLVYIVATRNTFLLRLLIFALACNLPQLLTDWYHARVVRTLAYDYALFRVLETPDYIIAGWGFAFLQLGYLVLRLRPRLVLGVTTGLVTGLGTLVHSWYEEMAYLADAWRYLDTRMVGHVSLWVIVSFALIIATICLLLAWLEKREGWGWWVLGGLLNGVGIFVYSGLAVAALR
ncbi:MAG TPA: hypothetical protein EYH30_04010 [Anaerolineales bacterium]|nr:hypothetical protein [Anaerolineae bacterium]HIQ01284.1 hypothetical protein [Anaerolineales bacterium]